MTHALPIGNFQWLNNNEINLDDVWRAADMGDDSPIGYFLEVDISFPEELHEYFNDYPFAPERVIMRTMEKSPMHMVIQRAYDISRNDNTIKLLNTLLPKKKYLVHYRLLKFYIDHGAVIDKVHRTIMFDQRPFMKDYIQYNTDRRTAATNEEEKTAIKLTTNSTYGKFVENLKKRTDIKLVTDEIKAQKLIAKPHCTDARIFDENLIGIELRKVEQIGRAHV
jgi:hypothetical protein